MKKRSAQVCAFLMCFIVSTGPIKAATVYVDLKANGNNDGSSWSNAFTSVRAAVAAASAGDELLIAEGRYLEGQLILINKALTLRGGFPTGGGAQDIEAHPTIFDGNYSHRVINISQQTHLEGLRIFNGFSSDLGGSGIRADTSLTLVRCHVVGNVAPGSGGIFSDGPSLAIHHSRISGNLAFGDDSILSGGGGIQARNLLLNHSVVHGNRIVADNYPQGGGVWVDICGSCQATIIHSRISDNQAIRLDFSSNNPPRGGGIGGNTTLIGSVLWGNTVENGDNNSSMNEHEAGNLAASHSLIRGQNPAGVGNIDATAAGFDPGFLLSNANSRLYNFGLQPNSVLIDAGDVTALPSDAFDLDGDGDVSETIPQDLLGDARIHGADVDIGPFELDLSQKDHNSTASHYYFDRNSQAVVQDGLSWATAFSSLNDWFYLADRSSINQLSIATGHYPTTGTLTPSIAIDIKGGLDPSDGSFTVGQYSVIDPGHDARVMTANLTARGVAFQHSLANQEGGGLSNSSGSITLVHSRVIDNAVLPGASSLTVLGGGIRSLNGTITLWSSDVIGNRVVAHTTPNADVDAEGGGIVSFGLSGSAALHNSRVLNNWAVAVGGGDSRGGGVIAAGQAVNSLIANNRAVVVFGSVNSDARGAGWFSNLALTNSSLWGNTATENGSSFTSEHAGPGLNANHSLIRGQNPTGTGNIDATVAGFDPGFVAEGLGDYRLTVASPLLDVADATALPADQQDLDNDADTMEALPLDIGGLQRIAGADLDIGPHERPIAYLVGGITSGLFPGNELTLQNNAGDDLLINANGAFSFTTPLAFNDAYAVTILTQPSDPIQPCTVNNNTGSILNDDIMDVLITCEAGTDLIFRNGFDD